MTTTRWEMGCVGDNAKSLISLLFPICPILSRINTVLHMTLKGNQEEATGIAGFAHTKKIFSYMGWTDPENMGHRTRAGT